MELSPETIRDYYNLLGDPSHDPKSFEKNLKKEKQKTSPFATVHADAQEKMRILLKLEEDSCRRLGKLYATPRSQRSPSQAE